MLLRTLTRHRLLLRLFSNSNSGKMPKKQPGYYVVSSGYKPGIYRDFDRVLEQVTGFSHGRFRKFRTYDDAYFYYFHTRHPEPVDSGRETELFERALKEAVAEERKAKDGVGDNPAVCSADETVSLTEPDIVTTFCNVRRKSGEVNEVVVNDSSDNYTDYTGVRKSARIQTQAVMKYTEEIKEADNWSLEQFQNDIIEAIEQESKKLCKPKRRSNGTIGRPKKEKQNPETGETFTSSGVPIIYTDGCCTLSSLPESERRAGCGVYWGRNDPRNIIERLWGTQTNQRAELWAAVRGVQSALQSGYEVVEIRTDSQYVIQGMTNWINNWKLNGWMSGRNPVKNKDMFVLLDNLSCHIDVRWVKVKAHSNNVGNDMADALAKCGAALSESRVPSLTPSSDRPLGGCGESISQGIKTQIGE